MLQSLTSFKSPISGNDLESLPSWPDNYRLKQSIFANGIYYFCYILARLSQSIRRNTDQIDLQIIESAHRVKVSVYSSCHRQKEKDISYKRLCVCDKGNTHEC